MPRTLSNTSRIATEVNAFTRRLLGLHPESVFIDTHENNLTVSLHGILPEGERSGAREKRFADLIVRNYRASFDTVRDVLESRLAPLVGCKVECSSFLIDPQSNCATIIINLINLHAARQHRSHSK